MDYKDISNKTEADLQKMLNEQREALRVFRFNTSGGKIKNVKDGSVIKKNIAKIMTAVNVIAKAAK